MKFMTGYEDPQLREAIGLAAGLACKDDSLTVQADAKDADINVIMSRYQKTGQLPPMNRLPSFGDFDQVSDFRSAIELVRAGEDQFSRLPAQVRSRFDNDPAAFLDFAADPSNHLELLELGVVNEEVARDIRSRLAKVQEAQQGGVHEPSAAAGSDRTRAPRSSSGKGRANPRAGSPEGGETT